MAEKDGRKSWVMVNRAPVLMLWAAVVTEVLGFEQDEAVTLVRAVAGLNSYSQAFPWDSSSRRPGRSKNSAGRCVKPRSTGHLRRWKCLFLWNPINNSSWVKGRGVGKL